MLTFCRVSTLGMRPNERFMQAVCFPHLPLDPVAIHRFFEFSLGHHKSGLKRKLPPDFLRFHISQANGVRIDRLTILTEQPTNLLAGFKPLFVVEFVGDVGKRF